MKQVTLVIKSPAGMFYKTIPVSDDLTPYLAYAKEMPALLQKTKSMTVMDENGEYFLLQNSLLDQSAFAIRGL